MDALRESQFSPGVSEAAIRALRSAVRGEVLRRGDAGYEEARRVYNAGIDKRPAVIVRCVSVADVVGAVNFAREEALAVAVRAGSHNVAGFSTCDDGIVVDLSAMKGIWIDPTRRTVRAEGGCTWGDLDHATHAFGLACPGGIVSTTGIAGLTLGGGIGHLTRRYGLSIDNLVAADVVLADGSFVTATAVQHPELFWALRGGGGNFGVVTSFEFKLHPVAGVLAGPVLYPLEKCKEAMQFYREFMDAAPDDFNAFFAVLIVPPGPPFPEHLHNKTVCGVCVCCTSPKDEAEALVKPLREFGPPVLDFLGTMPFPALQSMFDGLVPKGLHHYWKADFVDELTDEVIAAHVKHGPGIPTFNSAMHIYPVSGAAGRVGPGDTAFAYRGAKYVHVLAAMYTDPADTAKNTKWVRDYWQELHPHSSGGAYVNFMMEEGDERVRATYGGNYERLTRVKRIYDPDNLFHINQNVRPS